MNGSRRPAVAVSGGREEQSLAERLTVVLWWRHWYWWCWFDGAVEQRGWPRCNDSSRARRRRRTCRVPRRHVPVTRRQSRLPGEPARRLHAGAAAEVQPLQGGRWTGGGLRRRLGLALDVRRHGGHGVHVSECTGDCRRRQGRWDWREDWSNERYTCRHRRRLTVQRRATIDIPVVNVIWHKPASPPRMYNSLVFVRWRQCAVRTHVVPWAPTSPYPKRHLNQFSRFFWGSWLCPTDHGTSVITGRILLLCTWCGTNRQ